MALSAIFFTACGEDSSNNSNTSEQAACSVSKNDDAESYTLKCLDGTEVVIHDGKNGSDGKNGDDGGAGISGEGCSVKSNDDGSFALTCPDGTNIDFYAPFKMSVREGSENVLFKSIKYYCHSDFFTKFGAYESEWRHYCSE